MAVGLLTKRNREINKVVMIPLKEIDRSPNQPRKYFDPDSLLELSRSIASNGLLQPITVRRLSSGRYELIAGERRTMAYRALDRKSIPAIVEEYSDEQSAVLSLIENLQRKDLNYFEEAAGIAKLMQELGLTQQEVSVRLGKAQSTVANKLRLLKYTAPVQEKILRTGLTERHARAMLRIPEEELQLHVIDHVVERNLNVEQTEQYIDSLLEKREEKPASTRLFVVKDVRLFFNTIQKAVNMMDQAGIQVNTSKREVEEYLEYTIKIPKSAAYRYSPNDDQQSGVL